MKKKIIIIGGGISGLSVLHYLRTKYSDRADIDFHLFEKESSPGGTIRTIRTNGIQFETGPNGFLDSKPSTLALARTIGLETSLISASPTTKIRYLCINDQLHCLPTSLPSFITFKPLTLLQKLRILKELIIRRGVNPNETVYEFGTRRLGVAFAKFFLDPMVSGIFGGDAKNLTLKYAFPRIYEIEQTYGSLFKGMIQLAIQKRKLKRTNSLPLGQPTGQLWSFQKGMGQLTETLAQQYSSSILYNTPVEHIIPRNNQFSVSAAENTYNADHLILSVPAYVAAHLLKLIDPHFQTHLKEIRYGSICVVGLLFDKKQIPDFPKGFGYLRPTHENKEILGVLFSSQIYPPRCSESHIFIQVMLGGSLHPETYHKSEAELFELAENEIKNILQTKEKAVDRYLVRWEKAIPQYTKDYPEHYLAIKNLLKHHPRIHIVANYLDGISLNDCTANAELFVKEFNVDQL